MKPNAGLFAMVLLALVGVAPRKRAAEESTEYPVADLVQGAIGALILVLIIGVVVIPTITGLDNKTWNTQTRNIMDNVPTLLAVLVIVAIASLVLYTLRT